MATHETEKDGFVTFHHLVRHDPNNKSDRYYIKCTPDKMKGDFVFKEKEESYYPLFNNELSASPSIRQVLTTRRLYKEDSISQLLMERILFGIINLTLKRI
ncbi:MAG: hypothetical protein IPQ27_04800 [Chitinophagaceae bacterium]|nr:hypothetical protein [Chitinophagaceae bacterium]